MQNFGSEIQKKVFSRINRMSRAKNIFFFNFDPPLPQIMIYGQTEKYEYGSDKK